MEEIQRRKREIEAQLQQKKTRETYVKNHITQLSQNLQDRSLTRERRREIEIEKQDYEEELSLNQLQQSRLVNAKLQAQTDEYNLMSELIRQIKK